MGTLLKQNHKEVANKLKLHLQETTQITNSRIDNLTETNACKFWYFLENPRLGILGIAGGLWLNVQNVDKMLHREKEGQIMPLEYLKW